MHLTTLIWQELRHRWANSALTLLGALLAIGCLSAALVALHEHRLATAALVAAKEDETRTRLTALADDMRKITVRMGFNILILPKDQNLGDFYAEDFASRTMPEEYATRLAGSGVVTINHILPSLQQKVRWQEQERIVLAIGVRGELPITGGESKEGKAKKPLLPAIPAGKVMLGHDLHRALGVKPGDVIRFQGHSLTVSECRPQKGTKDDISLWLNLAETQKLLNLPGRINTILALECNCAAPDRLAEVRSEVARILPDTQVIEFESQALARAEARNRAEAEGVAAIAAERDQRTKLEQEKERLVGLVVPLALLVCGTIIGLLSWQNVRERRLEIAILRTLGLGTGRIMALVLCRAVLIALAGSLLGFLGGLQAMTWWAPSPTMSAAVQSHLTAGWLLLAAASGPALALAAAWLPALVAAQQDPATILREA
jgi:ABC-type lipoprotein release transport system permease subunit